MNREKLERLEVIVELGYKDVNTSKSTKIYGRSWKKRRDKEGCDEEVGDKLME